MSEELTAVPPHYDASCVCPNCSNTRTLVNERDALADTLAKVRELRDELKTNTAPCASSFVEQAIADKITAIFEERTS